MSLTLLLPVIYASILLCSAIQGTLTPDGTVPLDCGSQQTFTCSVTGVLAGWNISGLSGISVTGTSGQIAANNNARINTTNSSDLSSTITITGFTKADDGGTIQCINLVDGSVQGMASISVGPPSCSVKFTHDRIHDFTRTNVTWQQPPNTPPVTSTTVTYCPTSSPNCGNSMNCTSPCTISGLNACEDYQLTVVPTNNCGGPTGCTGNSVMSEGQGVPSCPTGVQVENVESKDCLASLTWQQPPNTPPVTFTTVTYCPTSSPNCGNSMTCTSPCNISGLNPGTEYQFTVIPNNNCGSPTGCTGNMNMTRTPDSCMSTTTSTASSPPPPDMGGIAGGVVGGLAGLAIAALATYAIAVLIAVLCCTSCEGRSYCHVFFCQYCCGGEPKGPSSIRAMSADEYADPQKVREEKEKNDKITYATLEFSEKADSSGKNTIRSKEEPVQYLSVEQA